MPHAADRDGVSGHEQRRIELAGKHAVDPRSENLEHLDYIGEFPVPVPVLLDTPARAGQRDERAPAVLVGRRIDDAAHVPTLQRLDRGVEPDHARRDG